MNLKEDCRLFEEQLELSLTGRADADTAARLEAHLADCPDCAALAELRRAITDGRGAEAEDVPEEILRDFWPDLRETLEERRGERRRRPLWPVALAAAALLSLLLNLALLSTLNERGKHEGQLLELLAERETTTRVEPATGRNGGLIARHASMKLGDLLVALESLPPETVILSPDQARHLARHLEAADAIVDRRELQSLLRDDLEAEELRRWLARHPVDPEIQLSPRDLAVLRDTEIRRSF